MLVGDEAGFIFVDHFFHYINHFFRISLVGYHFLFLVVNCIQCHPFDSVVATSGIDNTIKVSKRIEASYLPCNFN